MHYTIHRLCTRSEKSLADTRDKVSAVDTEVVNLEEGLMPAAPLTNMVSHSETAEAAARERQQEGERYLRDTFSRSLPSATHMSAASVPDEDPVWLTRQMRLQSDYLKQHS